MILGFSTHLNGKPTYFVEKIHSGLLQNNLMQGFDLGYSHDFDIDKLSSCQPKLHTLRDDLNDRWHVGMMIDFFINVRTKKMFRFAPKLSVLSTQEVFMTYAYSDLIQISIDGRELFSYTERLEFAINDGFDCWEDFFNYFYPKIKAAKKECYKPKLIHWTDLKY
ncbi:hypothetical protein [Flavobacterium maritimum]|uniref:hypothetical protein n=1 Tax=Flavobacterium maritimum TaxID=3149042 RepID=UPI0032B3A9D9